jgi:hypothetical protein
MCGNEATTLCPRCYRYVCSSCIDPITFYCLDCASFKHWQEEDCLRFVDLLKKKLEYVEKVIENKECANCILLKDAVLQNVRRIKELEHLAKLESFENLHDKVLQIKEQAQNLAVKYLVHFKMKYK